MLTRHTCPTGVLVNVKSLEAAELDLDVVKYVLELPSGAAAMAMVTPFEGIALLIVTFRVKGPTAAAWVLPDAGEMVTSSFVSVEPPLLFPQAGKNSRRAMEKQASRLWAANRLFIKDS